MSGIKEFRQTSLKFMFPRDFLKQNRFIAVKQAFEILLSTI